MLRPIEKVDISIKKDIIINHIMKSKSVYLLVSNPKVGKSMLALQLSCSVINGTPFLGYQVNPSPVLYITTESDFSQLQERLHFMELVPKNDSLFPIDRKNKINISLRDIELEIKSFSEDNKGKLIIIDMLKDIDFGIDYDINNYQDIAQKILPKLRYFCDKYNITFLVTHHLNKSGKTLGSVALDATVDGRITLVENKSNKKYVKLQMINRDFPELDIQLKKQDNLIFKKIKSIE
ncbi:MAG: AAA family ATPase, partial [Mycoplasmatota bacterium]